MGTLLLYSFGINGIIYVHQLRICHFLQGIWLIGHDDMGMIGHDRMIESGY